MTRGTESIVRYKKLFTNVLLFAFFALMFACGGGGNGNDDGGNQNGGNNGGVGDPELGSIRGTVRSSNGIPLNAVHVRAVNLSDSDLQVSTFSGITSNLRIQDGFFEISNLPPGSYKVLIEKMDSRLRTYDPNRYSDFVISDNPSLSFPDEYYNGQNESSNDDTDDFVSINVTAGQVSGGVNFITND